MTDNPGKFRRILSLRTSAVTGTRGKTATDLEPSIRTSCEAKVKGEGCGHHPSRKTIANNPASNEPSLARSAPELNLVIHAESFSGTFSRVSPNHLMSKSCLSNECQKPAKARLLNPSSVSPDGYVLLHVSPNVVSRTVFRRGFDLTQLKQRSGNQIYDSVLI